MFRLVQYNSNTKAAMTVEELLRQRSTYKALVTKSSCTLSHLISEGDINRIQKHGVMMKAWFHSFDEASESYLETLTDDTDITAAESYYDAIYDDYMDQLDSLNYAMDSFTMQAPAVVQRTDSNITLSTISPIINLPKMVREQETKSPIQPVQSVVQNNETVLINTHNCTCQPLPSQQIQEDMSIELVHLSTCVHDHTAPNCDKSLLDLHIDVKAQSEVSISTITMEQQPDLFDCEPPVTIQCSPVSLHPHIDQTDLYVPSPTPCAHYSHTAHTTMHLDRNVPSRRLLHPDKYVPSQRPFCLTNGRSADHHILHAPPQDQLELKECYIHSQTPRPGRKVKDGTLHITSTPRPTAYHFLSGIT